MSNQGTRKNGPVKLRLTGKNNQNVQYCYLQKYLLLNKPHNHYKCCNYNVGECRHTTYLKGLYLYFT